ncbi:MAG: PilZ domain-containing protein [Deltaproteobacteria bacterium]|nr:PilZ domain-containing protein [Deltaproteobacteria bacterium]MBI4373256.1 PilZ domain-containing protein [Deltaproteobacteria bacterium]
MIENRKYPRKPVLSKSPLTATLVLTGGSLINTTPRSIEIAAQPLDLSQGGIGLVLKLDVPWETLLPRKEVALHLNMGNQTWRLMAKVARHAKDHRTIGLEFTQPLPGLGPFFTPTELQ